MLTPPWCGEAYGTDAVTPVAWISAQTKMIKAGTSIMQIPARAPTCAEMTAMTLQAISGNRFLCGIGPPAALLGYGLARHPRNICQETDTLGTIGLASDRRFRFGAPRRRAG
jgi:alkanesulfonate monooxygenase SsuD/methylene tetrahydromethanopterin reductase-like flavin-dependent oxidoreductase (luciferase family)